MRSKVSANSPPSDAQLRQLDGTAPSNTLALLFSKSTDPASMSGFGCAHRPQQTATPVLMHSSPRTLSGTLSPSMATSGIWISYFLQTTLWGGTSLAIARRSKLKLNLQISCYSFSISSLTTRVTSTIGDNSDNSISPETKLVSICQGIYSWVDQLCA